MTYIRSQPRAEESGPVVSRHGVAVVWWLELVKLSGLVRVQVIAGLCVLAPFLVALAVSVQSATPADTLFGQWLHESGYALPLVVLGFAGQWVLPLLTAAVAGDIFSSEDRFGTWKTVLTRSRSRWDLFAGKGIAVLTYTVVVLGLLTAASVVAGLLLGSAPIVGLSGQLVPASHAVTLVIESWAWQLPPLLGFAALAILLSILTRNSVIGVVGPVVIGLVLHFLSLVNLPSSVRLALLTTPFDAWHGLWTQPSYSSPLWHGLLTSAIWFVVCTTASWVVFRGRSIAVS